MLPEFVAEPSRGKAIHCSRCPAIFLLIIFVSSVRERFWFFKLVITDLQAMFLCKGL